MRLGTVSVLAGAAVLAAAGLAAANDNGPVVTTQSIGVELVVSGVPLVEYNPEAEAGLKYMPLKDGMELARSQGFSSIPDVPMMKLTASDASNIEDSKSPDVASIDPQKMFNIFGESLYWSVPEDWTGGLLLTGKVEVEGGPIDVTDRALFETYMQTLRLAARQVVDSAKCEPFVTVTKEVPVSRPKWGKGVRKRKTSESVRVALPRRVTDGEELTKDGKQKKDPIAAEGTPLNFAVRRFNSQKDLDERFKLSDTLTWDNSYRGVAANVPNAADYDPHLYCLGGRPPADVSVAISTVVPLVSFGYAPPRGQRDLGEFLGIGLKGWKDALAAARAAVDSLVDTTIDLKGSERLCQVDFVMRLPQVRSILVAIVYEAAVDVQVDAYGRAGFLEHFKKVAGGKEAELAKNKGLREDMESIAGVGYRAEYGGAHYRWRLMFKTNLADLTRALPRAVRRALARSDAGTKRDDAWAEKLAFAAAREFNQRRVLLGTEKTPFKWGEVNKFNVISTHDYNAGEKLVKAIKTRFNEAFTLGANKGVLYDEVKAKEFATVDQITSDSTRRSRPLRLKDTAHVMLLVEQQQGRANELAEHFATLGVDESVSVVNKLRWSGALNKLHTKLSDASTPFLPPCPKPDASGEDLHPCSNHPSFPQDFAARKKVEHVTDAIVKKFHVCMAPYSALAAIPGVEAATKSWDEETWPYYVSSCQRGNVPYVLFAPKKWEF